MSASSGGYSFPNPTPRGGNKVEHSNLFHTTWGFTSMKRIPFLLTGILALLLSVPQIVAGANRELSVPATLTSSLETTFAGGNGQVGNYFEVDVTATNGITISSMTGNFLAPHTPLTYGKPR